MRREACVGGEVQRCTVRREHRGWGVGGVPLRHAEAVGGDVGNSVLPPIYVCARLPFCLAMVSHTPSPGGVPGRETARPICARIPPALCCALDRLPRRSVQRTSKFLSEMVVLSQVAFGLNCAVVGAFTFVSGADGRTLMELSRQGRFTDVSHPFFRVWWPRGAAVMIPLIGTALVTNILAARKERDTRPVAASRFAAACVLDLAIFVWTALLMERNISTLMAPSPPPGAEESVTKFVRLNLPRYAAALTAATVTCMAVCNNE